MHERLFTVNQKIYVFWKKRNRKRFRHGRNPGLSKKRISDGEFRLFHLKDNSPGEYAYHYHDFHKLIWFIKGDVEYHIEGKSYRLEPHDILLVNKGEIHKPFVNADITYERYVFYISSEYLEEHSEEESSLDLCFLMSRKEQGHVIRLSPALSRTLFETVKLLEKAESGNEYAGRCTAGYFF